MCKHGVVALVWALIISSVFQTHAAVILQTASLGGSTYHLLGSNTDGAGIRWTDAEAYAVTLGGHLVTIDNKTEHDFLFETFKSAQFGSQPAAGGLYIGLTDQAIEGTFAWISGAPVVYTNWASGEPNNTHNREDWALMGVADSPAPFLNGAWNDIPNIASGSEVGAPVDSPAYAIMEIVPEPSSLALFGLGAVFLGSVAALRRRRNG